MKRNNNRFLSLFIAVAMLCSGNAYAVYAEPVNIVQTEESVEVYESAISDDSDKENEVETDSKNQKEDVDSDNEQSIADESVNAAEEISDDGFAKINKEKSTDKSASSYEENVVEKADNDASEESNVTTDLTKEQIEAKEELKKDSETVTEFEEGTDYAENEVILLCDTLEEAQDAAKDYEVATGYMVTVQSFQYGVAVLKIKYTSKVGDEEQDSVEAFVSIAADLDNNLPAVYPNYYRELFSVNTDYENDYKDPFLKKDSNYYQWYHEIINDKFVWNEISNGTGLASVKDNIGKIAVAVIDSGVDTENDDIADAVVKRVDTFKGNGEEEGQEDRDEAGHGSNVAGIIGNIANTIGGRGVASGVKIVGIKVGGATKIPDSAILQGLNFVKDDNKYNIKVVNISLGGSGYNSAYLNVLECLREKGILVVCAAGNLNSQCLNFPAAYDDTLCVASLNSDYGKSSFSNYGTYVDIAAPGGDYSTDTLLSKGKYRYEELWASGSKYAEDPYAESIDGKVYVPMAGTSQAAPVVAAVAALVYAQDLTRTADEVQYILESTVKKVNTGYNIGAGCVDAAAALGVSAAVDKPELKVGDTLLVNGQKITSGSTVSFGNLPKDAAVYYTLNGKNPDPDNMIATGTVICEYGTAGSSNPAITLSGSGKITLKAIYLRYGVKSPIKSLTLTYNDTLVGGINIAAANGQQSVKVNRSLIDGGEDTNEVDVFDISEGKSLSLVANITPSYAKNKQVIWESEDESYVTVDAKGNVKAISSKDEGNAYVKVTATAKDGSGISSSVYIKVLPLSKEVRIESAKDTIEIANGQKYCLSPEGGFSIKVYPEGASDRLISTSSNKKVATTYVDSDNKIWIEGQGSGTAVLTISSADGSGAKDTLYIRVGTRPDQIVISMPSEFMGLVAGKSFAPVVTFKYGDKTIVPDNKKITWVVSKIDCEDDYKNKKDLIIFNSNGKISLSSDWKCDKAAKATIKAAWSGDEDVSAEVEVDLYPITTSIKRYSSDTSYYKKTYPNGVINIAEGHSFYILGNIWDDINDNGKVDEGEYFKFLTTEPDNSLQKFTFASSNPKVVYVNSKGNVYGIKAGSAKITVTAADGSGKKVIILFTVYARETGIGFKSSNDINVIYPGKSITYSLLVGNNAYLRKDRYAVCFYPDNYSGDDSENWTQETYTDEVKNGYLKASGMKVSAGAKLYEVEPGTNKKVFLAEVNQDNGTIISVYETKASNCIEMYPAGTSAVIISNDAKEEMSHMKIGDKYKLVPTSSPANACQKYYTFVSGNTKVATVDEFGYIRAVANGTATITVTAGDGSGKKTTCKVTVVTPVSRINISSATGAYGVPASKSLQLIATTNADAVNKSVTWSISEGSNSASINQKGVLTAGKNLTDSTTVTVTATARDGSGKSASKSVYIYPLISKLTITDNSGLAQPHYVGDEFSLRVTPEGYDKNSESLKGEGKYSVTSSKPNIATVLLDTEISGNENGQVDIKLAPLAPGTTDVVVKANDGSGKSAKYTVKILKKVTELNITCKTGNTIVAAGKSVQMVATVNADATNKAVEWSISDGEEYATITSKGVLKVACNCPEGKSITVKAKAKDLGEAGKESTYSITTSAAASAKIIAVREGTSVSAIKLCAGESVGTLVNTDTLEVYAGTKKLNVADQSTMSGVSQEFCASSSNSAIVAVTCTQPEYDEAGNVTTNGKITLTSGIKPGTATIRLVSADGGTSTSIKVTVVEPMRSLNVYSKNGSYIAAEGTSLNMAASTMANVTNKGIAWSIAEGSEYASISNKGVFNVSRNTFSEVQSVKVKATAVDGSGTYAVRTIKVYPAQTGIKATMGGTDIPKNTISLQKGDSISLDFAGLNSNSYQNYLVTYNTGCAKVNYKTKNASETSVNVVGLNKGRVTIKAMAQDGSGKSVTVTVNVTN